MVGDASVNTRHRVNTPEIASRVTDSAGGEGTEGVVEGRSRARARVQ